MADHDFETLMHEHRALMAAYADAQQRCSQDAADRRDEIAAQQREITALQAAVVRLRGEVIVRTSALAFEREDRADRGARTGPNARSVLCIARDEGGRVVTRRMAEDGRATSADEPVADEVLLEASLVAADLVICQTGCVSHDAYWRVQDHCKRTGKTCVLVDQPQAMQWLRGRPVQAFMPPSMAYDAPVTNCASGLASHETSAATSEGKP